MVNPVKVEKFLALFNWSPKSFLDGLYLTLFERIGFSMALLVVFFCFDFQFVIEASSLFYRSIEKSIYMCFYSVSIH